MRYTLNISQIHKDDTDLVSEEAVVLGILEKKSLNIPNGFVVTKDAYLDFISATNLHNQIAQYFKGVDKTNARSLDELTKEIKKLVLKHNIPTEISAPLIKVFRDNFKFGNPFIITSKESSIVQVEDEEGLLSEIKKSWVEWFDVRILAQLVGLKKHDFLPSVIIQKFTQSSVSGSTYTQNLLTGETSKLQIQAYWGLPNSLTGSRSRGDFFDVSKQNFIIIKKEVAVQEKQIIFADGKLKSIEVAKSYRDVQKISDDKVRELTRIGKHIENIFLFPQEITWSIHESEILIFGSKKLDSVGSPPKIEIEKIKDDSDHILKGKPVSPGISKGFVNVIYSQNELAKIKPGEVIVLKDTNVNYFPAIKKVAAIISEKGDSNSPVVKFAKYFGKPVILSVRGATKKLKEGRAVAVNGSSGIIYEIKVATVGISPLIASFAEKDTVETQRAIAKTATKILVTINDSKTINLIPIQKFDGVGLLKAEYILSQLSTQPKVIIGSSANKLVTNTLKESLKIVCASLDPKPVIYRTSDFTSEEYSSFKGVGDSSLKEANPLIGLRGAARYIENPKILSLELEAVKEVRNKFNLKNLWITIPFVRTLQEAKDIRKLITRERLYRAPSFKVLLNVEVPSNVLAIDKFLDSGFDGVTIDLDDLTKLVLGKENLTESDYENEIILESLRKVISVCNRKRLFSSIYGREIARKTRLIDNLIDWGVSAISVAPDFVEKTREITYNAEKKKVSASKKD